MTTKTNDTFAWDEKNEAKIVELYTAKVEADGVAEANSNDFLGQIAKQVGAKSAQAVRGKLSVLKEYQKAATPRKVGGTVKTQKVHYIRAIQKVAKDAGVELTNRQFESLEQGVASDLQLLVDLCSALTGEPITVNPEATAAAAAPKQVTAKA